jgi:hypothetical protein
MVNDERQINEIIFLIKDFYDNRLFAPLQMYPEKCIMYDITLFTGEEIVV